MLHLYIKKKISIRFACFTFKVKKKLEGSDLKQ